MTPPDQDKGEEETRKFIAKNKPPALTLELTMNIEKIRFFALVSFVAMFAAGSVFSKQFIFYPMDDDAKRDLGLRGAEAGEQAGRKLYTFFGQEHPYIDLKKTAIWEIFGMPHSCSYIDFHPAKEVAAILLPLFSFPMTVFLILSHFRIKLSAMNEECPLWLYRYSRITTPFSVIVIQLTHLWFVNNPEEVYPNGFGFVGHYVPYALFQTSLACTAIMQVYYSIALDEKYGNGIPFGLPKWFGPFYVIFAIILTIAYQAIVIGMLIGKPILDSAKGGEQGTWERTVFWILTKMYAAVSLLIPMACSGWAIKSGDTNTFTMALQ
mmetsp:Transcript_29810/g.54587  ORF Transcript_29810/g.54587 Transcript_29810/m.54587 type:complete len:323 (-) Transcript_29810:66-1034(-)